MCSQQLPPSEAIPLVSCLIFSFVTGNVLKLDELLWQVINWYSFRTTKTYNLQTQRIYVTNCHLECLCLIVPVCHQCKKITELCEVNIFEKKKLAQQDSSIQSADNRLVTHFIVFVVRQLNFSFVLGYHERRMGGVCGSN